MKRILLLLSVAIAFKQLQAQQDTLAFLATGHVYISKFNKGHTFISPDGRPFVAIGIAHANIPPEARRTKTDATKKLFKNNEALFNENRDKWLLGAGFNTFSYTSPAKEGNQFYWVETLNLFPGFINKGGDCPDLFNDSFRNAAIEQIRKIVPGIAKDKLLLGISLGLPVLASPHQMPTRSWQRRNEKPTNYLYHIQSLDRFAKGKQKYIAYLQKHFGKVENYCVKRNWKVLKQWNGLLDLDISAFENPFYLHPDDAGFYLEMWTDVIALFAKEVKKYAPDKIVFAPRLIGLNNFPDNWLDEWFKATGPFVDAFIPELYATDDYLSILNRIGELTGRPCFIGDGMRPREFNYASQTDDADEAVIYEKMFSALIKNPWFLGATICEYHTQLPAYSWYAERLAEARTGIRNGDYSDRHNLLSIYKRLHLKANAR